MACAQANYYANNFNDLASGLVVCFELLVVNNWFIICEGFAQVACICACRPKPCATILPSPWP